MPVTALLATLGQTAAFNIVPRQATNESTPAFDWNAASVASEWHARANVDVISQVTPAGDLKTLVPCFDSFQCGRLNVPLDYSRTDGPNTIITVAVLPATDKANYKGAPCRSIERTGVF